MTETQLDECPRNPGQTAVCDDCECGRAQLLAAKDDFRPLRQANAKAKRQRTAFDPETMGFGKHPWEYINPAEVDVDALCRPPDGEHRRDFNTAFNTPHPETTMNLDYACRPGTVFETNHPSYAGKSWTVTQLPERIDGTPHIVAVPGGRR